MANAFPTIRGHLRGSNLIGIIPNAQGAGFWYELWYQWGTEASAPVGVTWTTVIKPQIDAIRDVGGNLVRLIGDLDVRYGDVSHHNATTWNGTVTLNQFQACLHQIITYTASLGMYFYGCCMDSALVTSAGVNTGPPINNMVTEYCAFVSQTIYTNVVGVDLSQEVNWGGWSGSIIVDNMPSIVGIARTAMAGQRSLPLTFSAFGSTTGNLGTFVTTGIPLLDAADVDFVDAHIYLPIADFTTTALDALFANAAGLPVMFGETGIPYISSDLTAFYAAVVAAGTRNAPQAILQWAIVPQDVSVGRTTDYGMYDEFFVARSAVVAPFQLLPEDAPPPEGRALTKAPLRLRR